MRIAIGIITMGRAAILADTLRSLARQSRPPDRILVCATARADTAGMPAGPEILLAPPGTSLQRNRLIEAAADSDLLVFLDDDFLPAPDYLQATETAFADPRLVVSTGTVLADGAKGPGIAADDAHALLHKLRPVRDPTPLPAYNGYGCNMAVRLATVRATGERFDEAMPFYAWYEDLDFTRRLARHGTMCRLPAARGIHLGTKTGRGSGLRLGYAQVVNPIYIARKGSYHWNRALRSVGRNILMNLLRSPWPEPWLDRAGRLQGNLAGLADLLRGHIQPDRAARLR